MSVDNIDVMIKYTMCWICMVHEGVCGLLARDQ